MSLKPVNRPNNDVVVATPIPVLSSATTNFGIAPCNGKIVAAWVATTNGSTTTGSNVYLLATQASSAGVTNGLITLSSGAAPNSGTCTPSGLNDVSEGDWFAFASSGVNSSGTGSGVGYVVIRK